jgi:diguanylate cyclase (GGDEF)-like protein
LLVVDDNSNNRDMLSRRLIRHGYAVEVAENGPEALAKINQAHYDLVVLDQMMPGMSGLDLLRLLRATYSQSELPVIMVTAVDNTQSVVDALGHGANDYVVKPVDMPVVAARIQSQLERSRADHRGRGSDALTKLCDRSLFLNHLTEALKRPRHDSTGTLAVLLINLDGFRMLNDSFGHASGDFVLIETARRFQATLSDNVERQSEVPLLARVGGHEFAVLLHSVGHPRQAETVAQALLSCLDWPFQLANTGAPLLQDSGSQVSVSASVGITTPDSGESTAAELMRDAGLAMSCAREHGRNSWQQFDPAMRQRAQVRMALAMDLPHAIARNQLAVFYQTKVHLATRTVVGFEALLRWRHPEYGPIPPNDFIPIAEETGEIVSLGKWILRQACMQLKAWQAKFPCDPPLSMNVNLSVKQLADPTLVSSIEAILAETGVQAECINLELTESSLVSQIESARDVLAQLQTLRVGLDLDDFGTGYSSLSYLRTLRFDSLKIDRSFVNRLDSDPESGAIIETILNLARTLHMTVVAEGIESEEQLAKLIDLGCDTGQGFLFSKPVAADSAEAMLASAFAA